jgi:hypothetical protein
MKATDTSRATHIVHAECFHAHTVPGHARPCLRVGTLLRQLEVTQATTYDCAGPWCSTMGTYEILDGDSVGMVVTLAHGTVHDWDGPVIAEHPGLARLES